MRLRRTNFVRYAMATSTLLAKPIAPIGSAVRSPYSLLSFLLSRIVLESVVVAVVNPRIRCVASQFSFSWIFDSYVYEIELWRSQFRFSLKLVRFCLKIFFGLVYSLFRVVLLVTWNFSEFHSLCTLYNDLIMFRIGFSLLVMRKLQVSFFWLCIGLTA